MNNIDASADISLMKPILEKLNKDNNSEEQLVVKACNFALEAHKGQKRLSGEEYVNHPFAVAQILADIGMDAQTIAAAILHDVLEDTDTTLEQLEKEFGKEIATLVDGVTKLKKLDFFSKAERQAESIRKMLIAMSKDVRVILIKLADRLHNMRTLSFMSAEKQSLIAKETLDIYAPLAHRLGIFKIRSELEDLSLIYLEPEEYNYILGEVNKIRPVGQDFLGKQKAVFKERLEQMNIKCEVEGREKHIYSLYKKMIKQNRKLSEIYDFMALRIIVETIPECYAALGMVHTMYKPIPGRFKDFIAVPKVNMYQSLHTTVINNEGVLFEVQIRTFEMHKTAEYGVAAHWKYKEGKTDKEFDKRIAWLRELQDLQKNVEDPHEFLETVQSEIFSDEVFVFTPKGDVITLVRGATPIDFAYKIHSKVGDRCVGAKVNGRIVPLDNELKTGDVVEILTSNSAKGPSRDWLNIARTNTAKSRIRQWFKRELKEENIIKGREMLDRESKRQGYDFYKQLAKPDWLEKLFAKYSLNSIEDLYSAVGYGGLSTNQVLTRLIEDVQNEKKQVVAPEPAETKKETGHAKASHGIIVKGHDDMLVRLAHCCNPVPGDDIVGIITWGRGVSVHRADCSNLVGMTDDVNDRLIEVRWAQPESEGYNANLRIIAVYKTGIFAELSRIISNKGLVIVGVNAKPGKNSTFIIDFIIRIRDTQQLYEIINHFRRVPDVIEVYRG